MLKNDSIMPRVNYDDLAIRYKHIEEFFMFESLETKENGITDMEFSCVTCAQHGQGKKVLKTSSQAPTSNLKHHIRVKHKNLMGRFHTLLETIPRKPYPVRQKNRTSVNSDNLEIRYKHIEEYFIFESSETKENGLIDLEFSCVNCADLGEGKKILKTCITAPMSNLKVHLRRIHPTLIDNFKTLLRSTPRKSNLKRGANMRQKNRLGPKKPYKCFLCDKSFRKELSLKEHTDVVHEGKKPHHCDQCAYQFRTKDGLKLHIESAHEGRRYQCAQCGKSYTQQKCNLLRGMDNYSSETLFLIKSFLEGPGQQYYIVTNFLYFNFKSVK